MKAYGRVLFGFIVFAILPLFGVSLLSYRQIRNAAEQEAANGLRSDVRDCLATLDSQYTSLDKLADTVLRSAAMGSTISEIARLSRAGDMAGARYVGQFELGVPLGELVSVHESVDSALVLVDGHCQYAYRNYIPARRALPKLHAISGEWLPLRDPYGAYEGAYIVIAHDIHNIAAGKPKETMGQFVLLLKQSTLAQALRGSRSEEGVLVAYDAQGRQLYADTEDADKLRVARQWFHASLQGGEDVHLSEGEYGYVGVSKRSGFRVVSLLPESAVRIASGRVLGFGAISTLALLSVCGLCLWIVIGQARKERRMHSFQMNMLKYQINPHFFYNTLNSIRFSAQRQGDEPTADMLAAFSRLLRKTLHSADTLIPLEQELDNIRDYVALQNLRYRDRLCAVYDIEAACAALYVPGMILQPIVENAIAHGLPEKLNGEERAEIRISARREGERVVLTVRDNGKGMDAEALGALWDAPDGHAQIGIRNIHQRVQLLFGARYGVRIESEAGEYTAVHITLPVRREGDSDDRRIVGG